MTAQPRITFGIIVLNGEPFTRYNLRALYPFAHQIIVVEGASPRAKNSATPDGHSTDGTLEILRRFKEEEDPENKLVIVTAEDEGKPDGFWMGEKDEQSRAYAKRATGDWLWQVDIDEFWLPQDIARIRDVLLARSDVDTISFDQIQFWGGLEYYADGWFLRHYGAGECHRIFRWQPGSTYVTHRPPTVTNPAGVDLRELGWVRSRSLTRQGVFMYHYSLVFPALVEAKSHYYRAFEKGEYTKMLDWEAQNFARIGNPYRVHNVYQFPSWLERFRGMHPPQVSAMWSDIRNGRLEIPYILRRTDDIEQLLQSPRYRVGSWLLKHSGPVLCGVHRLAIRMVQALPLTLRSQLKQHLRRETA